ncbi:hypothetical protein OPS25_13850 [Alteromonas ponticola]|uniref:CARDB domain-containing protein n=1 Tax=Alteromonas aquimaris TaxID=2998417 RepID=A0ABT3P9Y5_9ALTE|nr:hypothetical protein [Alteromonas aquimaris]MCW8109588.1 hypothetical protein [Alteromonas aquimaris]
MIRAICFVLLFAYLPASSASSGDEKALALYLNAEEAFNSGNLVEAREFATAAIELKQTDGIAQINVRKTFKINRVGRQRHTTEQVVFDKEEYYPNKLLSEIERTRIQRVARAQLLEKRSAPPKLALTYSHIVDEDNDNTLSGLEKVRLTFELTNVGQGVAEDVTTVISLPGIEIEQKELTMRIGELLPGQRTQFTHKMQLPQKVSSRFQAFFVSASEKDGLGELDNVRIPVNAQNWLAPVLKTQLLAEHSDPLQPQRPSVLRYRVTNVGKGTARDVNLSLNFGNVQSFHILDDIDLKSISQLKVGESRDITFKVQAEKDIFSQLESLLFLDYATRGIARSSIPLELTDKSLTSSSSALTQWLAKRASRKTKRAKLQNRAEAAVLTTMQKPATGRLNNTLIASQIFTDAMGVSETNVQQRTITGKSQWYAYFTQELTNRLVNKGSEQFYLHLSVEKVVNTKNRIHLQMRNSTGSEYQIPLTDLYAHLAQLPVANVVLFLEAPFLQSEASPVLIIQTFPMPPPKVRVFASAMKGSDALADSFTGAGLFTAMILEGLQGEADQNNDAVTTTEELHQWLSNSIPYATSLNNQQAQYPVYSGSHALLNTFDK